MYSFIFPSFAVKIVYIIILQASSHTKKIGNNVLLEKNLKKVVKRPRRIWEENFKKSV